jgi:3-dehydroquinate synthase
VKNSTGPSFRKVRLPLGPRSHEIHIGPGAIGSIGRWLPSLKLRRAFIIADQKLDQARQELVASLKKANWEVTEILVHAGEDLKDFKNVYPLYGELLKGRANRDSVLFALGGGSVGDAASFVASTYLRGIPWVSVPTTLLGQVDSGVGGKTGINHSIGKNLIGSFHQPILVVCDTNVLSTLSQREIMSGLGEMIKYGIALDSGFFNLLNKNRDKVLKLDPDFLTYAIQRCVLWKAKIVAKDELDRKGLREVLNFGHTFAHALESATQYRVFQHGEAVIWGMRFALALSEVRKKISLKKRKEIDQFLCRLEVPLVPSQVEPDEIFRLMGQDKKVRNKKIHFVLLKELGKTLSDANVKAAELRKAYHILQSEL